MKINSLNTRLPSQLWTSDRKMVCYNRMRVQHVGPCQDIAGGFPVWSCGLGRGSTSMNRSWNTFAWSPLGSIICLWPGEKGRCSSDDRNQAWTASRCGILRGKTPRRLLRDLVSVVCIQLSWLGWENHETVMTSWAAHDREPYVEEKNARRKEIHCHEVSSRPNKWENAHPGSRNNGASWKGL